MLANQGAYLRFPFSFVASATKLGKTGLAATVNVYRNGSATPVATGTATEWVKGLYYYDLSGGSVNADGEYVAVAETSDETVASKVAYSFYTVGKAGTPYLDAAVSSRLATAGYTTPPTAAAVSAAVWAEGTRTITGLGSNSVTAAALASDAVTEIAAGVFAGVVEGSTTFVECARLWNSALGGKASGLATTTAVYRDLADSKARITATVDADGNRTAITRDLS